MHGLAWLPLFAAFLVNPLLLVVTCRVRPHRGLFHAMVAGFWGGVAVLLPGLWWLVPERDWQCAQGLVYVNFCYIFFHFNNMGETARRIRLLRELVDNPSGPLPLQELARRYSAEEIIQRRIQRMIGAGQVVRVGDRYHLRASHALWITRGVTWLKETLFPSNRDFHP